MQHAQCADAAADRRRQRQRFYQFLGFEPGPAFRAALQAAEDVQLQGGDEGASLGAARAVLAQAQDAKRS